MPPGTRSHSTACSRQATWLRARPGPGAASTTPSAPPGSPRRSLAGWPSTAAPRPPPTRHRSGRSYSCHQPAAAAPGTPASAARPAPARPPRPAAGPAAGPARLHLPPPRSAPATPPPRPQASRPERRRRAPAARPAALRRADHHRRVRGLMRVHTDHHYCHQHAPSPLGNGNVAGMPNSGPCWRSHLFRATPRREPTGWHLVLKPDRTRPAGG